MRTLWLVALLGGTAFAEMREPRLKITGRVTFDGHKLPPDRKIFAQLSREFERCVYGLNLVKNELRERQHPIVRRTEELIM